MLKKTIHRPNHRERAQPVQREKWGILEKHKDYSLRARDFQEKKKRLQTLRQKAAERNPDEFRYGMLSSRSKQGRKIAERGNPVLSHEVVKLLKTQDAGYLRTMIQKTRRVNEKLEQEFVLQEDTGAKVLGGEEGQEEGQHVILVNNKEEQNQYLPRNSFRSDPSYMPNGTLAQQAEGEEGSEEEGESTSSPPRRTLRSRRAAGRETEALNQDELLRKQHKKGQNARQAKLTALKAREKDLVIAENELELQRAKMSNSVGGVTKAGIKWRPRERKR